LLHGKFEDETSNDVDEEKVECFSKLMTVIGSSLEQQSEAMKNIGKADAADSLADCWKTVEIMAGKRQEEGPHVSNRIKFMLQDLLEMKEKGWVTRRKEETAKTIAQIHKEVAKEERANARKSSSSASLNRMSKSSLRRGASSGDVRVLDKAQQKPQVDADGFVSVASTKGFHRSASMGVMPNRNKSSEGFQKYTTRGSVVLNKSEGGGGRRPSQGKFAVLNESNSNSKKGSSNKLAEKAAQPETVDEDKPKVNYLSPDECGDKAKNVLKEFFVGGDTDDAVLSIHELVGAGDEGSIDRGSKVVEQAVLMVLEMKQTDVDKFLSVYLRCAKEKKIEGQSFVTGLNDPLEFLNDVAIDAPLAIPILASIVAELVKSEVIPFNFLLDSPEYFRTDQNAADFGAKVMKKIGGDATTSEDFIDVIEKLMTDEDKAKHSSAKDLIAEA
jgi:translation initiation factor 4G